MNFFNIKTTWTNAELIILKLSIATAYLLIGSFFKELVNEHYFIILIIFLFTVVFSIYLWVNKMKRKKRNSLK